MKPSSLIISSAATVHYGQAGLRLHMQASEGKGSVGAESLEIYEETRNSVGLLLGMGGERILGSGALALELDFYAADLDHRLTGNTTSGGWALQGGYHFFF